MGFDHALFAVVGYFITSACEWAIHRYCMHAIDNDKVPGKALKNINKQHLVHHNATKTDMTIVPTHDQYKKKNLDMAHVEYQGLYFIWPVNIAIFVAFLIGAPIVQFVCKTVFSQFIEYSVTYREAMALGFVLCLWMNLVWNWVHPELHMKPGLKITEGLDLLPHREFMKDTFVYKWLWNNHVLHHLHRGRSNYNVTLPGADWLFGTYETDCKGYELDVINKIIYVLAD